MTEHTWTEENVAAYLAGGLTAQEAERLEAHAGECDACAALLTTSRGLEREMNRLFVDLRPGPELEDGVVNSLRTSSPTPRKPLFSRWSARAAAAVAAVLLLGAFGALAGTVAENGLPMPGSPRVKKESARASGRVKVVPPSRDGYMLSFLYDTPDKDLTNEDPGLQSNLEAALPDIERVDKQTVNAAVTMDNLGQPNAPDTDTTAMGLPGFNRPTSGIGSGGTGQMFSSFPGRSGATKSVLSGQGGGNDSNSSGTFVPGEFKPRVPGVRVPTFASGADIETGEMVKETKLKPPAASPYYVQKETTVMEREATGRPSPVDTVTTDKSDPPKTEAAPVPRDPKKDPAVELEPTRRVILRSGNIEFEVPSFDVASATVTKLVGSIKGAFIATINSEKMPNGKVRGSITVRTPPEFLDTLVLDLRKELGKDGELKGVRLASQDVTKQYTDIESRLRGARTMETRLLQIIKEGKGEIKQLLEAEKELGIWRTRIEEFEGELRYFANLAAMSTLTISLTEKDIRAAAVLTESDRVQAGVEVEDVDTAYQQLLKAIAEAKGRISKSELKQLAAGQFNASLNFEVAPDAAGQIRDRLKQLGRIARLEIDRTQRAEAGTLPTDAKLTRGDTVFLVQLYNLANVMPRETATLNIAVVDVPVTYQALRDVIAKTSGRVYNAQINEVDRQNITATLDFDVKRAEEPAIRAAFDTAGDVLSRQVVRTPENDSTTDSKVRYTATLVPASRLKPREVTTLGLEVANVDETATVFAAQVAEAKGRQADAKFTRESSGKTIAKLVFEVPLTAAAGLVERFKAAGTVRASQSVRDPQATDGKFATARIEVTLGNRESIVSDEDGLGSQVRRGLSYSASVLLTSVTWVIFGLCVILPWAMIGYVLYRVIRRMMFATVNVELAAVPPAPTPTSPPATA